MNVYNLLRMKPEDTDVSKNTSALNLLWIAITSIVGSGWLFGSLYAAHFAGPAAILAWPIAGILMVLLALSYAEIATMFPQSDALARLPLYTHGLLTSVIMTGLTWVALATIPVIETQGLLQYASNYIPNLIVQHDKYQTTTLFGYALALLFLTSFVLLNYFGFRLFSRINAVFTIWKLLVPSITIICLLLFYYHPHAFTAYGFMPYGWHGVMTAISSGGVLFSLMGFRQVVIMMDKVENPGKCIPLILITSLIITTILYTSLQWSFIGSMQEKDLLHGWANLSFVGDAGPFAALAMLAGLVWLSMLLYTDAFISPYATGLVYSTTAAYILASMGKAGDMPEIVNQKNKYDVPWISLLINLLLGALMFLVLRDWQEMSSFLVAVLMLSYALGPICLICLRKQLPQHPRPFRLRGGHAIAFIGFYICSAGVYWSGFHSVLMLIILTMLTLILYILYSYFFNKNAQALDGFSSCWLLSYIFGLGIFSYYGNFGGNHFIPLYLDMLYLMGFSLFIFLFAFATRKTSEYAQMLVTSLL